MSTITFSSKLPERAAFFKLFETTGWNTKYHASAEELANAIAESWAVLSAYVEDELVGFGRVLCDGSMHALILDLIVDPEQQGQGIGSELLSRLVSRCQQAGVRDIQLFSARGKAPFYERHGFRSRPSDSPGMELPAEDGKMPGSP